MSAHKESYKNPVPIADEVLIWLSFKNGDKEAYAYFYTTYSSLLFRYGCKVVADRELLKDCIHDLFTEIWKNKSHLTNPASVKNYLVKSLRNKLIREMAKQTKFVNEVDLEENDFGHSNSIESELVLNESKRENEQKLVQALRTLTNKQKEIIFLLYYNNLSPVEVAAIMSVSVRTIYNTTFNAIQSLKSEMAILIVFLLIL